MKGKGSAAVGVFTAIVLVLLFLCPVAWAGDSGDIYTARTVDGVDLAMWRYRPDPQSPLREGAQPVILMPGMACNFNFFNVHTPEGAAYATQLPRDPAPWAAGDAYLREDPMRYYSLAYYLWSRGYDVWLVNYRGQGRGEFRSGGASGYAIDELGIYDMPAIIARVREITGRKPVWAGHSMGGVMSYMYLEGARFENMADPDSRVISDPALVRERNDGKGPQALKGLVSLDGPAYPTGNLTCLMKIVLWTALYIPYYLDLRPITATLGGAVASPVLGLENLLRGVWSLLGYPDFFFPANLMLSIYPDNLNADISSFFFQYAADGFSSRAVVQFLDACVNHRMREDYRNGFFNFWRWSPPPPRGGDGYFYYSDNLDKISLPALVLVDATRDITNPEDVEAIHLLKTRDPRDRCYVIPGTAHADVVLGLNAPTELFPRIGEWLESL
ncbi:MAG: alpha/beta fold hydrolase [Actinomycetota bacterium]|nr:alpha/beta fold hydrolase [Actinomycetota bacterium]MDD5666462.1 alpha/beta fold hydrolase [Actinomycetota bacterium]